jgi:hypothetical protein
LQAGHHPVVYSPQLGNFAREIRRETIPVVDDLKKISSPPDIIHGQHANETLSALLHFPGVPAIFVCHDWYSLHDYPPAFPRILRYVGVDELCYEKLVYEHGVPEDRATLLQQFVDLKRFQPRIDPLPKKARRALILCNYTKENEHLAAARAACEAAGIELNVVGKSVGRPCDDPEKLLRDYEIVFAKGRTALEALAVGCTVIVYWWRRLGPVVTSKNLEYLRRVNFGIRAMGPELIPEEYRREIEIALLHYDAADATRVSHTVRATAGSDDAVKRLIELYEEVLVEYKNSPPTDSVAESRAAAAHLREMSMFFWKQREAIFQSTPFRLTERLLRVPVVGSTARVVARFAAGRSRNPRR